MDQADRSQIVRPDRGTGRAPRPASPRTRVSTTASWRLVSSGERSSGTWSVRLFFLGCVIVAGIFAGLTVSRSILWIQALPGAVALLLEFPGSWLIARAATAGPSGPLSS